MKTIITLKAEQFQKNTVGKLLWGVFSSGDHWKKNKKIII